MQLPQTTTMMYTYPTLFEQLSSPSADQLQLPNFLLAGTELTVLAPSRWTATLRRLVFGARFVPCCTKCGKNTSVVCNGLSKEPRRVAGMSRDSLLWPECFTCNNCSAGMMQLLLSW